MTKFGNKSKSLDDDDDDDAVHQNIHNTPQLVVKNSRELILKTQKAEQKMS